MKRPLSRRTLLLGAVGLPSAMDARLEPTLLQAAGAFLQTLTPEQKAQALFAFNAEERLNWHYVPIERKGLPYRDMTDPQRQAAVALVRIGLSHKGLAKIEAIRTLEGVLREMEKGSGPRRDPDGYFFSIFGEPAPKGAWGWRYEGHHCSLNWTVADGKVIAGTPQFMGANPAEVRQGAMKGTRVLAAEEDLARALLASLTDDQRKSAVISANAPDDIVTGDRRKAAILEASGLPYARMTTAQQGMLLAIVREYAGAQADSVAKQRLAALRSAGLDKLVFAWMGGPERGQRHYYRIQGPTFVIEYDNTQNEANHIHTVWRDFAGDFGVDWLERHYHTSDHAAGDH